jgi:drug/metabolite transporter (DMT)-like permease
MKASAALRLKTYLLLSLMIVFGPVGDVLLSKGMKRLGAATIGAPAELFHFFFRTFTSGLIWVGMGSLLLFFIAYILVLSWADFSYVQPASSVAYGILALLGHLGLGEVITPARWAGVFIICLGVFVVGHTPPRTKESHSC